MSQQGEPHRDQMEGMLDHEGKCLRDAPAPLDLIELSDSGISYDIEDQQLNGLSYYGDDLEPVEDLGGGSFGTVWRYASPNNDMCAVKVFENPDDGELALVRVVNELRCPLIRAITKTLYVNGSENEVVIMDMASGTLIDLRPVNATFALELLQYMIQSAQCLYAAGFVYTDYKPCNLLYRCNNDYIEILFGDLGGLVHVDEDDPRGLYTYPPPEGTGTTSDRVMVWGIAVTFMLMFVGDRFHHEARRVVEGPPGDLDTNIDRFCDADPLLNKFRTLLKGMFALDPEQRISLDQALVTAQGLPIN